MSRHALFNYFLYDDIKQYAATTAEQSKRIIELLQNRTVLFSDTITIWENTDGRADQYRSATALYLLSMLAHTYNIIIDSGVGASGHGIKVVDGLNANDRQFLSMLMKTVQLPDAADYDSHMEIYTSTANTDIGLARELQKLSYPTQAHGLLDNGNNIKHASKRKWDDS